MKCALYVSLAQIVQAIQNCEKSNNREWLQKHKDNLAAKVKEFMPSGLGFDAGTELPLSLNDDPNRLVFLTSYHHMDEHGYYTGWSEHKVIVKPSLTSGFDLRITGRDRHQIKDYIRDVFNEALNNEVDRY